VSTAATDAPRPEPLLELRAITKSFGGGPVLEDVDFQLRAGEIHGIVGENGAGKSTLTKILSGVHTEYDGEMRLRGEPVRLASPGAARALGVATIYQELSNIGSLTVAENVFLGRPPTRAGIVDRPRMRRLARERLARLGIDVDVRARLDSLSAGYQQMVEIARVVHSGAEIVILDEPTSALSPPETQRLLELMRRMRDAGTGLVFVSHFVEDVIAVCDRVTVLRNGRRIDTRPTETEPGRRLEKHALIELMLGRASTTLGRSYEAAVQLSSATAARPVLDVQSLTRDGEFSDVSFTVHAGEVLGLYGFLGCGASDVARCLFGATRPDSGVIKLDGRPRRIRGPAHARDLGIAYVHDHRARTLFLKHEAYKNVTVAHLDRFSRGALRRRLEVTQTRALLERLHVSDTDPMRIVGSLSGGNQQKVVLARWLVRSPRLLILNEPTKGIDVGAKAEVMEIIRRLRSDGVAILLLSAEPETVIANADRVLVLSKGRVSGAFSDQSVTKDMVMACA
jgi:ribose transport system ATP-binding protein